MSSTRPSKTDLMYEIVYNQSFVPLRSPKVNVKTTIVEGKPSFLMKNHATGIYYDIDEPTNCIWNLVDGRRTVKQIVKHARREKPDIKEQSVLETLLFFADCNLLVSSLETSPKKRLRVASPFEVDFTLVKNSNNFLQKLHRRVRPIYNRLLLWVTVVFIIVCTVFFAGEFISVYGNKVNFEILGSSVVGFFFYYFIALAPVIAVHEIAHAMTLVHYGGQAGEMGTGLFYFGPMFYTETTDAWGLNRRDRMMVYLAGNVSTLLIGSALVVVHLTVNIPEPASHILKMVAFYCFIMALMNFAPPFETDGYYLLSDIVNMPNLRRDSYAYLGSTVKKAHGKTSKTEASGLTTRKKIIFIMYAILSVAYIAYLVFQTSLFLAYMSQDVTAVVTDIAQSVVLSKTIQTSTIVIAIASVLYFGMQLTGYGFVFSAAVKKMTAMPLQVEAIHDRDLAVFTYLPPQAPEDLANNLQEKMRKTARKFTPNFEIKEVGKSCVAVLRMGATSLASVQIKEHLNRVEDKFRSAYQHLILSQKEKLHSLVGSDVTEKSKLERTFKRLATHCAHTGNPKAIPIAKACQEKQDETIQYLLLSTFGTVWTIEVQPAQLCDMEKGLVPNLLLEDVTLTDLYGDVENFKRQTIYGFDSLAKLSAEIHIGVKECLARPEKYESISILEPVKGRIVIAGRTEQIEKNIAIFMQLFVGYTFSGYLDNLLVETCFKLSNLSQTRFPGYREMREMSMGELAVLYEDLAAFMESKKLVDSSIQKSEETTTRIEQSLKQLRKYQQNLKTDIGMMDFIINVNVENRNVLPARLREFRKAWKAECEQVERARNYVEKEYDTRKPAAQEKKNKVFRVYPLILALFIAFLALGFQLSSSSLGLVFVATAILMQFFYAFGFYRKWKSLHRPAKYPSQTFSTILVHILALTEAAYGYAMTADVLTQLQRRENKKSAGR